MKYFDRFPNANIQEIEKINQEREDWLKRDSNQKYSEAIQLVKDIRTRYSDLSSDSVTIGRPGEINAEQKERLYQSLRTFMPWRKGPFNIFGAQLDAEWQSNRKWNRILPELPALKNKVIADIGCNNGYYMFRMHHYQPKFVLGFDPTLHYYYTYKLLTSFKNFETMDYSLLGVEHISLFKESFNIIFLMGILYHHPSPVEILRDIEKALKKGGTLIIETQGIPGDGEIALFPDKRYAKVPGTYFVPTVKCLLNFLNRTSLKEIKIFCTHEMNSVEQRKTDWMVFESYEDFIDPQNPELTIEGYPAPIRIYIKCRKK